MKKKKKVEDNEREVSKKKMSPKKNGCRLYNRFRMKREKKEREGEEGNDDNRKR